MGVAPEVVSSLLQMEGVVGPAVRAPSIQVTIPEDTDAYSTTLHTAHHCSTGTWAQDPPSPSHLRTLPHSQTHQQCQVLKDPSSRSHKVPNLEHWAEGAGEWIIATVLEIGVVPGLQGIGPKRGRGRGMSGQAGSKKGRGLPETHPRLLGEVELAEDNCVFDEQCEVLGLDQQGLPAGRTGEVRAGSAGPGALPWGLGKTYTGTVPLSTGHQPQISHVLWVPLNTTHWPVFMP